MRITLYIILYVYIIEFQLIGVTNLKFVDYVLKKNS